MHLPRAQQGAGAPAQAAGATSRFTGLCRQAAGSWEASAQLIKGQESSSATHPSYNAWPPFYLLIFPVGKHKYLCHCSSSKRPQWSQLNLSCLTKIPSSSCR